MGLIQSFTAGSYSPSITLDLKTKANAQAADSALVAALDSILSHKNSILRYLETYSGANDEVKAAMSDPSETNELTCFTKLLQNVEVISNLFNYGLAFEQIIPPTFHSLCGNPTSGMEESEKRKIAYSSAQSKIALIQRIIELFAYAQQFDNTRMMRPLVANDFSYYRRMLPKYHNHPAVSANVKVHDDDASVLALFTALHNPIFVAIVKAIKVSAENMGVPLERLPSFGGDGKTNGTGIGGGLMVSEVIATIANSCFVSLKKAIEQNMDVRSEPCTQAAKAMVIAATVYDHVTTNGVFAKKTHVRVKEIIELLQKYYKHDESIIGVLKYSTITLKHASDKYQTLLE